jgi:GDPmannose 4,6-dehydratase
VDETTPYRPSTYYGVTKSASAQLIDLLRRERGLWGLTTILFNHESTRRDAQFISRKVSRAVADFSRAMNSTPTSMNALTVRDISARADWSSATDVVRAMHLSLQAELPADYVLASGQIHSVRELLEQAFQAVGLDWQKFVVVEKPDAAPRPCLQGNPRRAREKLGWIQEQTFSALIAQMVTHDIQTARSRNAANGIAGS